MTTDTRAPHPSPQFWGNRVAYPDLHQRSITQKLPLGVRATDGQVARACFRENSAAVWGLHGSGRTITLYDVAAGLVQCTDAVVWSIGSQLALPLLRQYGTGAVDTPCIDWVAPTLDEALTMARTALTVALHRKRAYAELKYERNTNVMPVGDGTDGTPPAIIIVLGPDAPAVRDRNSNELYDLLRMIDDHGRDSAVRVVYSGFRPTPGCLPTMPPIRIGMRPTDPHELAYAFGQYDLDPIPVVGGGYLRDGDFGDVEPFKAFHLDPVRLSEIGEQTASWRPKLDQDSWSVDVDTYAFRWKRTAGGLWVNPLASALAYRGV